MKVFNRRARRDYELLTKLEAGVVLTGAEVKSIKEGRIRLEEAFVKIKDDQIFLFNAHISPYQLADNHDYDPQASRKLLLHKRQIKKLTQQLEKGLTIIPVSCYNKGRNLKIEIALARGKKKFDKREAMRKKDWQRQQQRTLKSRLQD